MGGVRSQFARSLGEAYGLDYCRTGVDAVCPGNPRPPVLESGDRLSRNEFERRYRARPDIKKAELIEGVVYVASPVRIEWHGIPHLAISGLGLIYVAATPGVIAASDSTVRLDQINEPQPDVMFMIAKRPGGHARIDDSGFVDGAPELVIEIASSSASYDLHDKKRAYERSGVGEYVVVLTEETRVVSFRLETGKFVEFFATDGVIRSSVFPGLWLDANALLANDSSRLVSTLNQGLATPEHQAFVERLAAATLTSGPGG